MPAVNPDWQLRWDTPLDVIQFRLRGHLEYIVHTGIGSQWSTYMRKPNGSLRRVKSKYLPERETKADAERDLYCWLWYPH